MCASAEADSSHRDTPKTQQRRRTEAHGKTYNARHIRQIAAEDGISNAQSGKENSLQALMLEQSTNNSFSMQSTVNSVHR